MNKNPYPEGFATLGEICTYMGVSKTKLESLIKKQFPDKPPRERLNPKQIKELIDANFPKE